MPQRFSLSDGKILGKIVPQAVLRRILRQQAVDIPPIGKAIPYAGEQRIKSAEQGSISGLPWKHQGTPEAGKVVTAAGAISSAAPPSALLSAIRRRRC